MPQLVGKNCIHCGERISSVIDGRFCATCSAPVHDQCISANQPDRCSTCGAAKPIASPTPVVSPTLPSSIPERFSPIHPALVGWALGPWRTLNKIRDAHLSNAGGAPYESRHVRIHLRISRVGGVCATLGIAIAGIGLIALWVSLLSRPTSKVFVSMVVSLFLVLPVPAVAFFYGTSLCLLFAPAEFFTSPLGQKWLKAAGVQSVYAMRVLCATLLLATILLVSFTLSLGREALGYTAT